MGAAAIELLSMAIASLWIEAALSTATAAQGSAMQTRRQRGLWSGQQQVT